MKKRVDIGVVVWFNPSSGIPAFHAATFPVRDNNMTKGAEGLNNMFKGSSPVLPTPPATI
jgi:hypothetical protein